VWARKRGCLQQVNTEKVGTLSKTGQLVLFISLLTVCGSVLLASYPIWREFRYQRYPSSYWVRVYLETVFLIVAGYWITGWCVRLTGLRRAIVLQSVLFVAVMSGVCIFLGTRDIYEQDVFPQIIADMHAKFLAEDAFGTFIFQVLLPFSILAIYVNGLVAKYFGVTRSPKSAQKCI